jgi:hypothetical protein
LPAVSVVGLSISAGDSSAGGATVAGAPSAAAVGGAGARIEVTVAGAGDAAGREAQPAAATRSKAWSEKIRLLTPIVLPPRALPSSARPG